jgi:hypothetical protein
MLDRVTYSVEFGYFLAFLQQESIDFYHHFKNRVFFVYHKQKLPFFGVNFLVLEYDGSGWVGSLIGQNVKKWSRDGS